MTLTSAGDFVTYESLPIPNAQSWTFFYYIFAKHSSNLGSNCVVTTTNIVFNSHYIFVYFGVLAFCYLIVNEKKIRKQCVFALMVAALMLSKSVVNKAHLMEKQ